MTERIKSLIQAAEMSFLRKAAGLTLKVCSDRKQVWPLVLSVHIDSPQTANVPTVQMLAVS